VNPDVVREVIEPGGDVGLISEEFVEAQLVAELQELLGVEGLVSEEYETAAGLVLYQLGHLPHEGESIVVAGVRIEGVDMDGRRIDKLNVLVD
jgi:CBS domain containing-hemolysin-like protein